MKCCFIGCNKEAVEKVKTYWNENGEPVCKKHKRSISKNITRKGKGRDAIHLAIG